MPRLGLLAVLLGLAGCGADSVHRPLELYVGGLSFQAEVLQVLLFPGEPMLDCNTVTLDTVQSLDAPLQARWERAAASERGLQLPAVDADTLTVVVFTEDALGTAIQLACRSLEYPDLEAPDVSIQLSARPR